MWDGPVVRKPSFHESDADGVRTCDVTYSTDPLEGTSRTTIKTELRFRLNETNAVAGFVDNGNVFMSKDQMKKFQQAYDNPVDAGPNISAPSQAMAVTTERIIALPPHT